MTTVRKVGIVMAFRCGAFLLGFQPFPPQVQAEEAREAHLCLGRMTGPALQLVQRLQSSVSLLVIADLGVVTCCGSG